ncbi:MAG: glycosyltransferase, partial [Mycobacteriales bacterium]
YPCPVVLTYHALGTVKRRYQGAQDTSPPGRVGFERALGRRVDRVIAQCEDEVAELLRLGVPRRSISLIPSGVDAEAFSPMGPIAPRTGRARILTVGRLVERKGFDTLISALPQVPDAELLIAGGPPESSLDKDREARRLYHTAVKAGVSDRVRLLGRTAHHHMAEWYRSADVVACTPWYEPFGLTPLEAMACGVPVVAAATGGLTDSVVDCVTGVHVPPRDPEATARALLALLNDPVRRICLGAAATDRVRVRYTWEQTVAQLQGIYEHVAERSDTCGVTS